MARKMERKKVMLVKAALAQGHSQIDIARVFKISQPQVGRISNEDAHRDVPWPPGYVRSIQAHNLEPNMHSKSLEPVVNLTPNPIETVETEETFSAQSITNLAAQAQQAVDDADRKYMEEEVARRAEKKIIMDRVREVADEIDEEDNVKYLENINNSGPAGVDVPRSSLTLWDTPFMEWETCVEKAPENQIVETMSTADPDKVMCRAIGIVFFNLAEEKWEDDIAVNLIRDTYNKLKQSSKDQH